MSGANPDKRDSRTYAAHTRRMTGWDYGKGASFFITISTKPRRQVLGRVSGGRMLLSPLGERVMAALESIPALNPGIYLFGHVVMPDHLHFNVHLAAGLKEPLKVLGKAIRRFKNYTLKVAKEMGLVCSCAGEHSSPSSTCCAKASEGARTVFAHMPSGLWQEGYHDHLCLNRRFIDSTERYIAYNAQKWELMYGSSACLRIVEPLDSSRLDPGEFWKGVGNVLLLGEDRPVVSLRVSRQVIAPAQLSQVLASVRMAAVSGCTIISGFISKGEQAVRDMLCGLPGASFIRTLPSCIRNARFKPESRYVAPFAEGRYLEIAQGNDEVAFGRNACLDLNAEIVKIAAAGNGLAVYWEADGPHILADSLRTDAASEAARTAFGGGAMVSKLGRYR